MTTLPSGWATASLDEIAEINPRHPRDLEDSVPVTFVRMPALSQTSPHFQFTEQRELGEVRKGFTHFSEGDVLFAKITPCMENGKAAVASNLLSGLGCGTTELHVVRPRDGIDSKYIYYFIHRDAFREEATRSFTGTAGQLRVPVGFMRDAQIPLPPNNEQRRIVAKLEELLSRVDTAQVRLSTVPRILKLFRQSVLAAACSGRLTAEWREENKDVQQAADLITDSLTNKKKRRAGRLWGAGVVPELTEEERDLLPQTWAWTKVRNLGDDPHETVQVGPMSMQSKAFRNQGTPVLNVGCVQWGEFDESKLNYLPEKEAAAFDRYRIAADDILFTRSGTVGRCAIARQKQNGYLMTFHLLRVRPTRRKCLPQYLQFVFRGATHIQRQTSEAAIGSTRAGFNTNLLANLDVPLPPLTEQAEIVRRVEAMFKTADALEARFLKAKAHVEKLTQSILAKAFRGELVPQDPKDEPASVLFGRICKGKSGG